MWVAPPSYRARGVGWRWGLFPWLVYRIIERYMDHRVALITSYLGSSPSGVWSFAKLLGSLQRWHHMRLHGSFHVSSRVVRATATDIPSSIALSFILARAWANSWSMDKSSIRVEVRRKRLTCSRNHHTNAHAMLISLNRTESLFKRQPIPRGREVPQSIAHRLGTYTRQKLYTVRILSGWNPAFLHF